MKRLRLKDVSVGDTLWDEIGGTAVNVIAKSTVGIMVDDGHFRENISTTPTGFLPKWLRRSTEG